MYCSVRLVFRQKNVENNQSLSNMQENKEELSNKETSIVDEENNLSSDGKELSSNESTITTSNETIENQTSSNNSNVTQNNTQSIQENQTSSNNNNTETQKQESPQQITTPKKEIWEELGLTEDQYYNQPMHSDQFITYSINDYGTREATELACRTLEEAYAIENQNAFKCDSVMSASGRYLGEMARRW